MIYLDHAATSPMDADVADKIHQSLLGGFYNISSSYPPALAVREKVEEARQIVAAALRVPKERLIFTSCATESNNWVIFSAPKRKNANIVISAGEHESIFRPAMELKARGGDVRIVKLSRSGHIDLEDLSKKIDENTCLISVIHCSNETGAINDLSAVCGIARRQSNSLIHADGVQAFCKIDCIDCFPLDTDVDFYTVSAHKIGGAKGVGALYQKKPLTPMIFGGGQEKGLRSGTENTAAIIGFGQAVSSFLARKDSIRMQKINALLRSELNDATFLPCPQMPVKGTAGAMYSDWILQLAYPGLRSEVLMNMLCDRGVIIGLGSACSSKKSNNRVLQETGMEKSVMEGSIRLSAGVNTTIEEAEAAAKIIRETAAELKSRL